MKQLSVTASAALPKKNLKNSIENLLQSQLTKRAEEGMLRSLTVASGDRVDFFSNDYLGLAREPDETFTGPSGTAGSRLLAGNTPEHEELEKEIARFHGFESSLFYTSGYTANLGILSAIAGKDDTLLYDELSHASIKDGARLSPAARFSFRHNDLKDLERLLTLRSQSPGKLIVITESLFSMDGDTPDLQAMAELCNTYGAGLIVDEAHAIGIYGPSGEGMVSMLGLQNDVLAVVYTYGKAPGTHGAAIAGSTVLRNYLINFSRPFIYTTSPPLHTVHAIHRAYEKMKAAHRQRELLEKNIEQFLKECDPGRLYPGAKGPIQAFMTPGNKNAVAAAQSLQNRGFEIKAILSPTVKKDSERLRIIIHSFNTAEEISRLCAALKNI